MSSINDAQTQRKSWTLEEIVYWAFEQALNERNALRSALDNLNDGVNTPNIQTKLGDDVTIRAVPEGVVMQGTPIGRGGVFYSEELYARLEAQLSAVRTKNIELEAENRKLRQQLYYFRSIGFKLPESLTQ